MSYLKLFDFYWMVNDTSLSGRHSSYLWPSALRISFDLLDTEVKYSTLVSCATFN